ncbi:hypothetical protein [Gordonia rhizosphera]|nr:hypothetical protein [Gordonia rhizosphera]
MGRVAARALASRGAHVIGVARRGSELRWLAQDVSAHDAAELLHRCDLIRKPSQEEIVHRVENVTNELCDHNQHGNLPSARG